MINAFTGDEHKPFHLDGNNGGAALLAHGFPGSPKEMRPVGEVLNRMGWTAHGVLLPGFGAEIETLGEHTADEWLACVENAHAELQRDHDTILIVGNSMGGGLSIQVAARRGADALILFAPFWTIDNLLWKALPVLRYIIPTFKPFSIFKPDFDDPEFRKGTRNFIPNADFDDPEFQEQVRNLAVDTRIFANIREVGMNGYKLANGVNAPKLVIQGTQDELVTPQNTNKLMQQLGEPLTYLQVEADHNPLDPTTRYWPQVLEAVEQFVGQIPLNTK